MSTRTRTDVILWGALGCALVATAHAEYTLATAAHFNKYVALAVPGALDLYVIRALQQKRDVFLAVLAMVAANVTSHLIAGGVLQVDWRIISAVGAVAPLIVWRVYSLKYNASAAAGAGSAPVPDAPEAAEQRLFDGPWQPFPPAPDHVPAAWMEREYPETHPSAAYLCALSEPFLRDLEDKCSKCGGRWGDHPGVQRKRAEHAVEYPDHETSTAYLKASAVPYLAPVPDLPTEYAASAVHSESPLTASDWDYLPGAQEYVDYEDKPTVRGLKRELRIGQERAERLLTHLGVIL